MGEVRIPRPRFVIEEDTPPYPRTFLTEFEQAVFEKPAAFIVLTSLQKAITTLGNNTKADDNSRRLVGIYLDARLDQYHEFDPASEEAVSQDPEHQRLIGQVKNKRLDRDARAEASEAVRRERLAIFASRVILHDSFSQSPAQTVLPQAG